MDGIRFPICLLRASSSCEHDWCISFFQYLLYSAFKLGFCSIMKDFCVTLHVVVILIILQYCLVVVISQYSFWKLYFIFFKNNKWNNFSSASSCLLCFWICCIPFDFTCYLEPKLFRELTRKPTASFSFLACTFILLNLINLLLVCK